MRERIALIVIALLLGAWSAAAAPGPTPGETIYRRGLLAPEVPLRGERDSGVTVEGQAAACATCHRRSGLGAAEGRIVVPPIAGRFLQRAASTNIDAATARQSTGYRHTREAYTDATLARAIRDGIDSSGRTLSYLMPRYSIDDASMAALTAYLRGLPTDIGPGVTEQVLHFATIITPDTATSERQAMLAVMQAFFEDKNAFIRGGARPMQATRQVEYRVSRRWQLHVWELSGPPATWERQLQAHFAEEPVFAVLSGLGGRDWTPVHRFCERTSLPCLFPNVDLPVVAEQDFYPMYFSRGSLLEADLMQAPLEEFKLGSKVNRIVQVFRPTDIGAAAAAALQAWAVKVGMVVEMRSLDPAQPGANALAAALRDVGRDDALVLWLRPGDLALLPSAPPPAALALASGLMAGLEAAPFPQTWRHALQLTYPFELPEQRRVRVAYALGWFRIHRIEVTHERLQVDTYVACGLVAETLHDMQESFVPDYLVERVEMMASHRLSNGYYPRLGLAPGQRFASKGGYLVRFSSPQGTAVEPIGDWVSP